MFIGVVPKSSVRLYPFKTSIDLPHDKIYVVVITFCKFFFVNGILTLIYYYNSQILGLKFVELWSSMLQLSTQWNTVFLTGTFCQV